MNTLLGDRESRGTFRHSVSPIEQLLLWGELVEAMHSVNGHGGNTAEIYACRMVSMQAWDFPRDAERAADALLDLCLFFQKTYKCKTKIDGLAPTKWRRAMPEDGFTHRALVEVVK